MTTRITEKTKSWKIPSKFFNIESVNFIENITDLNRQYRPIKGGGSLQEYADYFQLEELHGIDIDAILRLLEDTGCAKVHRKENILDHNHQNLIYLKAEIMARIKH